MEEKHNNATSQRPEGDRMLDAALVYIDLPMFTKQIKNEPAWENSDRNAITVFKSNGLRIVLIALQQGAEMAKHTANGMISVQVLEGKIKFSANNQTVDLNSGQMITLHEQIPHSVLALQESIFLLTLSVTTSAI
ncbi:MAG TPA: cupin domain-containing protein [Ferruginibacter sp.]|nr:cupin domain-containing protein [Ferruginibacter sp.]